MDFGMFTMYMVREGAPQIEAFREWMKLIELAEEVGLDSVWLGETHFRPQRAVLASPLVVAGAVAARTSNINVGIAVQVLPLANPVRVAEEAAMIDHMSEGRLVFGVGRSSFLESYQGYNIDYGESRSRYFESLEIILRAWGEEPFSFEGEFYNFQNVNVVPKPFQKPHPPIRVAVESRDLSHDWQQWLPHLHTTPDEYRRVAEPAVRVPRDEARGGVRRPQRRHSADTSLCGRDVGAGFRGSPSQHHAWPPLGAGSY
jgi:alkanesulfonate monooxygenase SsuD/methylene tetrahydromethanopterin reductase-like flavin-dependent oxidoreductase (luciferase family)